MPEIQQHWQTDVLVVGGGAAAAMAAMAAAKTGLDVLLVDKGRFGRSGSTFCAGGNFSYWPRDGKEVEHGDSQEQFLADIINGGEGIACRSQAQLLVTESGECYEELVRLGLGVRRTAGDGPTTSRILGYTHARPSLQPVGITENGGVVMTDFFRREVLSRGVQVEERLMLTHLLKGADGRVVGALGLNTVHGTGVMIEAAAVVIAAGSAVDLFPWNSNFAGPRKRFGTTGDSYALLASLEVPLVNMEFLEFTVIPTPEGRAIPVGGTKPTTSAGARWYNRLGERIMERYDPERLELTSRNMMVLANFRERQAGRGPVDMDLSFVAPERYEELLHRGKPVPQLLAAGLDPRRQRIEWSPALHTFLGGALVDTWGSTPVPGLFAAGEAAGHGGAFGADRTGTAIAACLVLGKRAGRAAARWVRAAGAGALTAQTREQADQHLAWLGELGQKGQLPAAVLKKAIREVAQQSLNVVRSGSGLTRAVAEFQAIRLEQLPAGRREQPADLIALVEAHNLALTGELIARAALAREETRGQHHRDDFPRAREQWCCWVRITPGVTVHVDIMPVPE